MRRQVLFDMESDGGILQIVISRDERMIGIEHWAFYKDRVWLPSATRSFQRIWSHSYQPTEEATLLWYVMIVSWTGSLINELYQIYSAPSVLVGPSAVLKEEIMHPYRLMIWLPSIVGPALTLLLEKYMPLSWWILWVTCNELNLSIRLFEEGTVVFAFKMMMATMRIAAPELLAFSLAILVLMAVCAEAHGTQFGVFTDSYNDMGGAALNIYDMFANGANFEADGEDLEHNPSAYVLLYLFITLGLFLILAQYFIAILVGAFDEAKKQLEEEAGGASRLIVRSKLRHALIVTLQLLCGYSIRYHEWSAFMIRGLKFTLQKRAVTVDALIENIGVHATGELLLRFAQEPEEAANGENVDDEESNDSKSSPDPIEAAVLIPALAEKLSALRAEGVLLPAEFELLKAQLKTNKMSRFLCNI